MLVIFRIVRNFCAILSIGVSDSGQPIKSTRKYFKTVPIYRSTHENTSHVIVHTINFYILVRLNIQRDFHASLSAALENMV